MGFSTVATVLSTAATTAAAVIPKLMESDSAEAQANSLQDASTEQARLAARQADAIESTVSENQRRASRNANAQLAQARADAAVSNTVQEGSTYQRGVDLATRLQDEINATANEQLARANSIREQGAYDAWDLRNQAQQSRATSKAARASAVGSLFSGIASGVASVAGGLATSSALSGAKTRKTADAETAEGAAE